MKQEAVVRLGVGALVTIAYAGRLVAVGNGSVDLFGFAANPFALTVLALIVIAVPEIVDQFPLGPTRK